MPLVRLFPACALLLACVPATRPASAPAPEPPKALFEPYPEADIAHVKDPHEFNGAPLCQRCHHPDGTLTAGPNEVCAACHSFAHGNHPIDVVQATPAEGLPLLEGGRVACHTCHDPHQKKSVLRKPFNALCTTCHLKRGGHH